MERIVDPRSLGQRQHDVLEGVLLAGLRTTGEGPTNQRTVGSVTAVIQLKDLQSGTGFGILEGSNEVIPASAVQGLACDSGFCKRRAAACHAHHVVFYANNGPTDIDNGVLLCPAHHHALHQGAFEVRMIDGIPFIRDRLDRNDETAWKPASRNRLLLLQNA